MTRKPITNPSASIRQRLLNHARDRADTFNRVLTRYAIERFLYRLGQTAARDDYFLKGAMLFATWPEHAFRPTGDVDLLGHGNAEPAALIGLFDGICRVEAPEDCVIFDPATLRHEVIREEEKYQGTRLSIVGRLASTTIPVQIDVGFGDHVYPPPTRRDFPCLLPEMPAPSILMYPPETVVAEKFEALIRFGEQTTRLKDIHDIWVAMRTFEFELATLVHAIGGTLQRRETPTPTAMPAALTGHFADQPDKQANWSGFLKRTPPALPPPALGALLAELRQFFAPVLLALTVPEAAKGRWNPSGGTWSEGDV